MPDTAPQDPTTIGPLAVETAAAVMNAILKPIHPGESPPPTVYRVAQVIAKVSKVDALVTALRQITECTDLQQAQQIARNAAASVEAKPLPHEGPASSSLAVH